MPAAKAAGLRVFHGNLYSQSDTTQHANPGGDPGERDQSGPNASLWRQVHGTDRERAGLRLSEFRSAAYRDANHAEWSAGRGKRDWARSELPATGK